MCGRFFIRHPLKDAKELFGCETDDLAPNRYNIAPTQPISVIYENQGRRVMQLMRWGFIPSWVKDPKDFSLIINARSENVLEKPSFKSAIRHRRCIIPASGFYEWYRDGDRKTPYCIVPKQDGLVGYAGLYETYAHQNGSEIDTVCFLTTAASSDLADIHHRMPVVVTPEKASTWLDCINNEPRHVTHLYANERDDFYTIIPISDRVNAVKNDDVDIQKPVDLTEARAREPKPEEPKPDQLSLF